MGLEISQQVAAGQILEYKNLRPNQIEKYLSICREMGVSYFTEKLKILFEIELSAKSHMTNPTVLWELLVIKFSHDYTFAT